MIVRQYNVRTVCVCVGGAHVCVYPYVWNYRPTYGWNSTGESGRIRRHRAEKPDVEVTVCLGPMPPDASDSPGGIPAYDRYALCRLTFLRTVAR